MNATCRVWCLLFACFLFVTNLSFAKIDKWDDDRRTWTPLMICVYERQDFKIDSMIKAGVDINGQNVSGNNALWVAIMKSDYKFLKLLLKNGADPNHVGTSGRSLLMTACAVDFYKATKILIDYHAVVDYSIKGNAAITYAVNWGSPRLMKLLIKKRANVNIMSTIDQSTPLSLAKYNFYLGRKYKRKYRILKRNGAI